MKVEYVIVGLATEDGGCREAVTINSLSNLKVLISPRPGERCNIYDTQSIFTVEGKVFLSVTAPLDCEVYDDK